MNKTTEALRTELEDLKNEHFELYRKQKEFNTKTAILILNMKNDFNKRISTEKQRTDRVVQVLLNNLPKEKLNKTISFSGTDCCGSYRSWGQWDNLWFNKDKTLRDLLNHVITK